MSQAYGSQFFRQSEEILTYLYGWFSDRFPKRPPGQSRPSPQLRVLGLGLLEDGDVGVGIFPQCEEVLIGRLGIGGVAR
jgi:hypothetical protein